MLERRDPAIASPGFAVCFVSSVYYSRPLDPTSAKKFRALQSLGELSVLGFSRGLRRESFTEGARFFLLPSLPTPLLRYLLLYSVGVVVLLKWLGRAETSVLVAQGPHEGFAAALAKRIARVFRRRAALVVESHGDFELAPFLQHQTSFAWLYRLGTVPISRWAFRHADALRAVSSATRAQLSTWAPGKPVSTFPAWTDIDVFLDSNDKTARGEKLFLFAGVIAPTKAVDVLLEAFARLARRSPGARLEIVGRAGNLRYARTLEARARELGLDSVIAFEKPVPQAELAKKMTRSAALVLPSLSEGLGRVALEAMATGTLVIGSEVGGIVDLIADGRTGLLVPPGDVEGLAERMEWVLANPERAREIGQAARLFAQEFFSTEKYVGGYRELLSTALSPTVS